MGADTVVAELQGLQAEQDSLLARLAAVHARRSELLGALAGAPAPADEAVGPDDADEAVVHRGVELGSQVMLDEDVYAEAPAHVPPKVYVFDEYDSEAPAESNCTLVDAASGDWTVRGIGELVPVDEDAAADDEGTEER